MEAETGLPTDLATHHDLPDSGSYALHKVIGDVPVTGDDGETGHVTCVDLWNGNLYIGTSLGEVLHYVSLPPDPQDDSEEASYIFATKLTPPFNTTQTGPDAGVKRILVLPEVAKAAILCNSTLTFYTLPELSPAFEGKIKQSGCLWVGGVDQNEDSSRRGTIILLGLRQCLRLIRISDTASKIRDIQLGTISMLQRRMDLACVADSYTYSLLDVVNQRKNELFPVSSINVPEEKQAQLDIVGLAPRGNGRDSPAINSNHRGHGHERNISNMSNLSSFSINSAGTRNEEQRSESSASWPARGSSRPAASATTTKGPIADETVTKQDSTLEPALPSIETPHEDTVQLPRILPNIVSPNSDEFLLTTGTYLNDPGVGMFVNEEGDVVREPIEFSSYPEALVLEGSLSALEGAVDEDSSHVFALVRLKVNNEIKQAIEIQSWKSQAGESRRTKEWLSLDETCIKPITETSRSTAGLAVATSPTNITMDKVSKRLRLRRINIDAEQETNSQAVTKRNAEEDRFVASFAKVHASVFFYCENQVYWIYRHPLLLRLENRLDRSMTPTDGLISTYDVHGIRKVLNSISRLEAQDEFEYLTLTYIRQKASLLLLGNLISLTGKGIAVLDEERRATEQALIAGEIDPRITLLLIASLRDEIVVGDDGLWVPQGLQDALTMMETSIEQDQHGSGSGSLSDGGLLQLMMRYLLAWRAKKGFGSVSDEKHVFQSVDAALLRVLLILDANSPRGPANAGSIRAELNDIVDKGLDCFDRAVEIFEQHHRLYLLSRLYQSRKMVSQVLATWRRILDGEQDAGGELVDGEQDLRRYLSKIRDHFLVQEYGSWLARRNPKLGVQVFTDESSRVKFQPSEVVTILQEKAPGAVKEFLEHLVFGRRHPQYVNELIAYYLDTVLGELDKSPASREALLTSYETYRALHPPKPTYRQFITENAVEAEWWQNRLRLLQLIGGGQETNPQYDSAQLRNRLAPYSNELVPEMIILDGREGNHDEALRLLTHGLGDYDTAIRYCLLGGSSIFRPSFGTNIEESMPSYDEQVKLFEYLLDLFFNIDDADERLERTSELLERFAGYYNIEKVLRLIPDTWSIDVVSGFLIHAFRQLVEEKNETTIVRALSSAQNLKQAVQLVEKIEGLGPAIVNADIEAE